MKASAMVAWLVVAGVGAGATGLGAETFQVDPAHSTALFHLRHMDASHAYGRFNEVTGRFLIDEADPGKSTFDVAIKVESLDTANADRDKHLKGPDFFNAKQFPAIRFKSKSVTMTTPARDAPGEPGPRDDLEPTARKAATSKKAASKSAASRAPARYEVVGDLTLHGVTKPARFRLTVIGSGKGTRGESLAGVEATAVLRRSDFGMNYMLGPIGDEVSVVVALEGNRK